MRTPLTRTTEGALGLTKAIDTMWPKALRIRCGFHKMQNCQHKVPPRAWPEGKALLGEMRAAPTREQAEQGREALVDQYQREFPEWCRCLLDDAAASLNPLVVPQRQQQ
jgi:transposase-like protein